MCRLVPSSARELTPKSHLAENFELLLPIRDLGKLRLLKSALKWSCPFEIASKRRDEP